MQVNRFFELIYILLDKHTVTATEFAQRFEVSVRTIYRDVEALSQAGVPIYMKKGKGGGISLLPDFILNKTFLTQEEKSEILSSMRAFGEVNLASNKTAFDKLSSMLGGQNEDWIEVDFSSWGYFEKDEKHFSMLKTAIMEKHVVTFLYASGKAEKLPREVMPLKMVFKGAAWYLYGFCTMRKDYRFFKLRRITGLFVTQKGFDMQPPVKVLEEQELDRTYYIKTKLLISKGMAFRVYDEISQYELTENGDFICELDLPDMGMVCTYAASFGEHCVILSPDEAVSQMKCRLENSLKNYS